MITANAQRGAVLIVALVFTAILTVIGVGAMQNATLQERMAGNNKDINVVLCENGVEDTLGKLCVEDLKSEVSELKKGHDLLVKISR